MPYKSGTIQKNLNRNTILDCLRGLAVLMVLLAHWSGIGSNPAATASLLHLSVMPESSNANILSILLDYWSAFTNHFWPLNIHFASGGVLLFFLVSGFVIPMSVEKYSPLSFGIRRVFRLLPTLWAAIAFWFILNIVLRKFGYAHEQPFTYSQVLANMFLIHDWFWIPHIDLGFWTLVVEVKFYILMAAIVILFGRITMQSIAGLVGFLLFLSVPFFDLPDNSDYAELLKISGQSGYYWVFYFYRVLNNSIPFIIYMLMGTLFFLFQKNRVSASATFISCAALFAVFATSFLIGPTGISQIYYVSDGLKALTIFAFTIVVDRHGYLAGRFSILTVTLKFFGKISYSLYLIHGLFGMSLIYAIWVWSNNINISIFVGGTLVIFITTLVNKYIEEPSQAIGSKIAQLFFASTSPRSPPPAA